MNSLVFAAIVAGHVWLLRQLLENSVDRVVALLDLLRSRVREISFDYKLTLALAQHSIARAQRDADE